MERSNLEKYYLSIEPIKKMFELGILTKSEYQKAETFLADKYCIKKGNLYRLNDLTIPRNKVINSVNIEEVTPDGKDNNQARRITAVIKED